MSVEPMVAEAQPYRLTEGLRRIAQALAEQLPAIDTLPLIANEAAAALNASTVVVALREDDDFLRFTVVTGERMSELQGVRVRAADTVAGRAFRTGLPTLVIDQGESPWDEETPLPPTVAVSPIVRGDEAFGALLAMGSDAASSFSEPRQDLLALFADFAATAIALNESERARTDQAGELDVLYKASRSVSASLNLQEILDSVLDAVCDHLDYLTAVVFLANDEQSHLFVAAERGLPETDREIQLGADAIHISELLSTGRPQILLIEDGAGDRPVFALDSRIRAAMVAPICSRAEFHGVLIVTSSQPENFTENDLKLVEAVASHAGIAISNAWLYEDATQRAEHAVALYDLSQRLNASLSADHIFGLAVESVIALLNVDSACILLYDERTGKLAGRFARGPHAEALAGYSLLPGDGVAGWVFEWETPQSVADIAADSRNATAPLDGYGVASVLAVPMATSERVLGVLLAANGHRRLFTVGEMELLYTVANQSAVTLLKADLYAQARTKSADLRRYFRRMARALGDTMRGEDVPRLFADLALAMMRGAVCNVYALSDLSLKLKASATDRSGATPDETVPVGEGLTGLVARRGQHLSIEDVSSDSRLAAHAWTARQRFASYLAIPLRVDRDLRGVVEVYTAEPHTNMREELRLLAHFARLARVAERLTG